MVSPLARIDPTRAPLRWLLRAPGLLYRVGLGGLLGERFLQLTLRGRRSGLARNVLLEVVARRPASGEIFVASGWGRRSQWYQNARADPRVRVRVGWRRPFAAEIVELGESAAAEVLEEYARAHRWAYRLFLAPLLLGHRPTGSPEELAALARSIPILVIRR